MSDATPRSIPTGQALGAFVVSALVSLMLVGAAPAAAESAPQRESTARSDDAARSGPVDIVQAVGCVEERRESSGTTWWLVNSTAPMVSEAGVFNTDHVEEARDASPGSGEFELVGVADFLDVEGLLRSASREQFTTEEQANATGELRGGHTVLVKGLLIPDDEKARINLLAVVGLRDECRGHDEHGSR